MELVGSTPSQLQNRTANQRFLVGSRERFERAIFFNSASLIDLAMLREEPFSDALLRLPRFAASAIPAAICCFLDLAGIV